MKRLPLYPFLFVFYIVLAPVAKNFDQLDPTLAIRPMIVLFLAAAGLFLLFYLLFRDWQYAGYLVFMLTVFFFTYGYLNRYLRDQLKVSGRWFNEITLLVVWGGLIGFFCFRGVWARLQRQNWLTPYLNLVIALVLVFPAYGLGSKIAHASPQTQGVLRKASTRSGEISLECADTPDIYLIVLDAYGRADSLKEMYGFDNQPFLDTLTSRGFYVATESYTNYMQTIFSVPAALNFNYIDPPGEGVFGQLYFSSLVRYNDIMSVLKRCGYRTVAIESGFLFIDNPDVDIYLTSVAGLNPFERLLMADSPAGEISRLLNLTPPESDYQAHRRRVLYSFEKLEELAQMEGPKIVFAHIISPHPPFVFDASGQPLDPKRSYFIGDGDDYQGSLEEYLAGYPGQMRFVNKKLERVIDALLRDSASPPVIIIQGDHGPGSRLVWDAPDKTCLWERIPILNAYYLPGGGDSLLYPSISPVNSFRVVLNDYFKANLPLLPDKTYFTSHRLERQAIDITAERTSRANCGLP